MYRIQDFTFNDDTYEVYLTENVKMKSEELGLHEGIYLGATARLINRVKKMYNTFYYADFNVVFIIKAEEPNKIFFLDIKLLNIKDGQKVDSLIEPVNFISENNKVIKTYDNGSNVYIDQEIQLILKTHNINYHQIDFNNLTATEDGSYSMFKNGIVIDFVILNQDFYVTSILIPDFINSGIGTK